MTKDELEAIKARAAAATPGPWDYRGKSSSAAREDVPALVAEVERLQRENDEAHAMLSEALTMLQAREWGPWTNSATWCRSCGGLPQGELVVLRPKAGCYSGHDDGCEFVGLCAKLRQAVQNGAPGH